MSFSYNWSSNLRKNIAVSMVCKVLSYGIGFLTLPLSLTYLDQYQYGILATIASIIAWVDLFDFGLGQGLRNKLTEALALNDKILAKKLVSTTYFYIIKIVLGISLVFAFLFYLLPWKKLLNAHKIDSNTLNLVLLIVFLSFCAKFVFNLINKVFYAIQKPMYIDIVALIYKAFYYLALFFLVKFTSSSIIKYTAAQNILGFVIPLIISIYFYRKYKPNLLPSFKSVDPQLAKSIMGIGGKFFVIQLGLLVMYMTNNVMIANFVGPEEVTSYQIVQTLLSLVSFLFITIITPLWSIFTEAFARKDNDRVRLLLSKSLRFFILIIVLTIIIAISSPLIFDLWLGSKVIIEESLIWYVAILTLLTLWTNIYASISNAVSKISLQMYLVIGSAVLNIPISYFFSVVLDMGTNGIILGSICSALPTAIFIPYQAVKILNQKDYGIFNK